MRLLFKERSLDAERKERTPRDDNSEYKNTASLDNNVSDIHLKNPKAVLTHRRDNAVFRKIAIFMIRCYQYVLSPIIGPRCRFHPTCSAYMATAIHRHGVFKGSWFGVKRILRCHPFSKGGIDEVP